MTTFKKSNNPLLNSILSDAAVTSSNIESISQNVHIVNLPEPIVLNTFLIKIQLEKTDYDYGIAYVDLLLESSTEFNRNFNTYAFFFEKTDDNTITQIIDVNQTIYINFKEHPAFQISRTTPGGSTLRNSSVYAPVFPEQPSVTKNGYYLPLFPIDITTLSFSDIIQITDSDIYEVRSKDKKSFMSLSKRYNIFNTNNNIDKFNKSLFNNFYIDPNGLFGSEIQKSLPYVTTIPNGTLSTSSDSSSSLLSKAFERDSLAASNETPYTLATKSYTGDTPVLQYCTLRNKNIRRNGGIEAQYIRMSIDFYKFEESGEEAQIIHSGEDISNPASSLYLNAGSIPPTTYMSVRNIDGQNRPTKVDIYMKDKTCNNTASILGLNLETTESATNNVLPSLNFIQENLLTDPNPAFVNKSISSSSSLGLTVFKFLNNFDPRYQLVSSSGVDSMNVVDYRYINTCEGNTEISAYYQSNNQEKIILNDGSYVIFTVRILWT